MITTIEIEWCDFHDEPMRKIRTDDDRIVCWFAWWLETTDTTGRVTAMPCRPGRRLITKGYQT